MKQGAKKAKTQSGVTRIGGRHVASPPQSNSIPLTQDVHVFIGGECALRFYPSGQIQVPSCPEKRQALRNYISQLQITLEACS
jgi:hypothetical protein